MDENNESRVSAFFSWDSEENVGYLGMQPAEEVADGDAEYCISVTNPATGEDEIILDFTSDGRLLGVEFLSEVSLPRRLRQGE